MGQSDHARNKIAVPNQFRGEVSNFKQTPGSHGYTVMRSRNVKEQMRPPVVVCLLPP
jgi:hypothetical protein